MDKFEIGEVAILQNCPILTNGSECTVIGPYFLRPYSYPNRTGKMFGWCWLIEVPGKPGPWAAEADQLKKKRPPQDWIKLCNLSQIPNSIVKGLEQPVFVTL